MILAAIWGPAATRGALRRERSRLVLERIEDRLNQWSVEPRTNAAKRFKKTRSGVYSMRQVMQRLSKRWRRLKSAHLCPTIPLPMTKKKSKSKAA